METIKTEFKKANDKNKSTENKDNIYPLFNGIKSFYNTKIIFSFLNNKVKFDIIKYNNAFQKKFGISFENYKTLSGKYKINGINGHGEEYTLNTNILLFEGEYKNGKRYGIGKEYDKNGNLKYKGRYKNGKRDGEGKEYNDQGILIFEGEYLNGKKWIGKGCNNMVTEVKNGNGKVKIYNKKGILILEGEYINGEINGKVKEYNEEGILIFEGEYLNGKKWKGRIFKWKKMERKRI